MMCLAIMPFSPEFDEIYEDIRASVEHGSNGKAFCRRLDEVHTPGRITDDLVHAIAECDFCVADLTGINPNVMWEVGYAMALAKPAILISQSVQELPFDLRTMRIVTYSTTASTRGLPTDLTEAVRATVGIQDQSGTKHWRAGKRILVRGTAWPLRLIGEVGQVLEINPGEWRQELEQVEITIHHDRVQLRGVYRLHHGSSLIVDGAINGDGIIEGDLAYISYRVRDESESQRITGVLKLAIPQWGALNGYYLAESYAMTARTILGGVSLDRTASD